MVSVLMAVWLWQAGRSLDKGSHIAASHTILAVRYNEPGQSLVIILSQKHLAGSQMVLVYKRQRMPTKANLILKRKTITKPPRFSTIGAGFQLSGFPPSHLRNNSRER